MSPILTRPVREQLEHDRVIRQLQPRYKRKHEAIINPGAEQNQSVKVGELALYPDVVLMGLKGRKLEGTVEVETGESVNQLEALAEWNVFTKLKVPFHLYIPPNSLDTARRLCEEHNIPVAELWTYHLAADTQVRFTLVQRSQPAAPTRTSRPAAAKPAAKGRGAAPKKKAAVRAAARKPATKKPARPASRSAAKKPAKKLAKKRA